jgi:hypothetical protein
VIVGFAKRGGYEIVSEFYDPAVIPTQPRLLLRSWSEHAFKDARGVMRVPDRLQPSSSPCFGFRTRPFAAANVDREDNHAPGSVSSAKNYVLDAPAAIRQQHQ